MEQRVGKKILVDVFLGSGWEKVADLLEKSTKKEFNFDEIIQEGNIRKSSILPILEYNIALFLEKRGWKNF